ncbi:RNA polymerase subunit sigma [Bacillus sp. M6-12]|uniref:sigma-70 family RNA polymerase sigma factor n=1 Tax=Bacillus sp. M6-12 TaxID=2054166 RepID=UPI000C786041|nr:sigma-70 family RNA polymerase sigma factor [Bacillus sp. M6-12]PLS18310.1 RNA polymerase subunit sigma [Bacillus sp. M6-12]
MESLITETLLQRMKEGDLEAFDEVYQLTIHSVYKTVYIMVPYKQDVDDIVSEIYVQLWRSIHNYNFSFPFRFWLNGLVIRQVKRWKLLAWKRIDLLNKKKTLETEQFAEIEESVLNVERNLQLIQTVRQMSFKLRELVVLYYFHDYSLKEISELLDIPIGTVKSRHHLALKKLRNEYKTDDFIGKADSENDGKRKTSKPAATRG